MAAHRHGLLLTYLSAVTASVLLAFSLAPLAAGDPLGQFCDTSGNYSSNDTYQANLQSLAATLPKNTSAAQNLFAKATNGTIPNMVYALALCRGDTNASACESCVSTAFQDAQNLCAYNKGAAVFYDPCMLHYSPMNFLGDTTDNGIQFLVLPSSQNVSAPFKVFDAAVGVLLNATADYAAANSSRRFGTGVEEFRKFDAQKPRLYALAQCTPDTAPSECRTCLGVIIQNAPQYFSGKQGGRVHGFRCNYRYEQYSFFDSTPLLQLPELKTNY